MGTIIKIILGIVVLFAIIGFLFSKNREKEEGAKIGAISGLMLIGNLIPTIIVIVFVVLIVKACT